MGFLSNALETLGKVGNVIDLPASSLRDVLTLQNPFDQWKTPTTFDNRIDGRQMLERWGLLGENTPGLDWGDVAGFGAGMVADPLNLGLLGKAGMTARAGARARRFNRGVDTANDAISAQRADALANNAIRQQMLEKGALPAELESQAHKLYKDNWFGHETMEVPGRYTPYNQLRNQPMPPSVFNDEINIANMEGGVGFEMMPPAKPLTPKELEAMKQRAINLRSKPFANELDLYQGGLTAPREYIDSMSGDFDPRLDPQDVWDVWEARYEALIGGDDIHGLPYEDFPGPGGQLDPNLPDFNAPDAMSPDMLRQAERFYGPLPQQKTWGETMHNMINTMGDEISDAAHNTMMQTRPNPISGTHQVPRQTGLPIPGADFDEAPSVLEAAQALRGQQRKIPLSPGVRNNPTPEIRLLRDAMRQGGDALDQNVPYLVMADWLDEVGDPAGELLRRSEELIGMGRRLREGQGRIVPAMSNSQSFYVVPKRAINMDDPIPDDLAQAWLNANEGGRFSEALGYPPTQSVHVPEARNALEELQGLPLGNRPSFEDVASIRNDGPPFDFVGPLPLDIADLQYSSPSSWLDGNQITGTPNTIFRDATIPPGMEMYLPYVAPEYQELPEFLQMMNVPQVRKGRLAARLGGYNAVRNNNFDPNRRAKQFPSQRDPMDEWIRAQLYT